MVQNIFDPLVDEIESLIFSNFVNEPEKLLHVAGSFIIFFTIC